MSCPCMAPAEVEMLSLISVPPRSFTPAVRRSWDIRLPSFTQDAWMLGIQLLSMIRAMAWTLITSMPVGPERTLSTVPLRYMGASEATKLSGTNSVKPPVCCWMSRSRAM